MTSKLKFAFALTLSAALIAGGAAVAAPAFAADKVLGKKSFDVEINHGDDIHFDRLTLVPASKVIVTREGMKAYRLYTVVAKDGARPLFTKKLGATKALLLALESRLDDAYYASYKSDAVYAAHLRAIAKESNQEARKKLAAAKRESKHLDRISQLQADVSTTKLNIAAWLAEDGLPSDITQDQVQQSLPSGETVTFSIAPDGWSFKVVGTDTVSKVRVTFDSNTGEQLLTHLK